MGFLDSKIKNLDNGRQVLEMPNSVNFGVITKDNKVLLALQSRAGNDNNKTINLFGGYIEKGESAIASAIREAYEEANIREEDIDKIEIIYTGKYVSVGYTSEKNYLVTLYLNKTSDEMELKCNDKNEEIEIVQRRLSSFLLDEILRNTNCMKLWVWANHTKNNFKEAR